MTESLDFQRILRLMWKIEKKSGDGRKGAKDPDDWAQILGPALVFEAPDPT